MTQATDDEVEGSGWAALALDFLPGGLLIVDANKKIVYWNATAQKLIGIAPLVPAEKWTEEYGLYFPDERTPLPASELPLSLALSGEETRDLEIFVRNERIGKGVHLLCSSTPLRHADGRIRGAACIFRDNTQRRHREVAYREKVRQMRAILDNIPDIAWLKDREGRFLAVNQQLLEAAGKRDEEEVLGLTDLDLFPRELAERYRSDDADVMRTRANKRVEEPFIDSAGRTSWIETIKTPIVSDHGEVIGTTGIARDITERKRAEEALKMTKQELERRVAEAQESLVRKERLAVLGQLAGGVAHQIRNPLAAIMNASYVLKRHVAPDQHPNVEDAIKIIHDEVRHANVIITGLLDHARVRAPDRHPASLSEVVDRVLASDWIPSSIRVERAIGDVPLLDIDADQLHGAIFNIVRNAVEAMPDGGTLRVELAREDGHVVLGIADTGPGISAHVRQHLFEPLHSTKPLGIGLGLVTARTFVEAHGGRIAHVDVQKGARFEIRLPVSAPPS